MIAGTAYRTRRIIGRGGMGSVYEVEHVELGRNFVLKALHEHLAAREDLVGRMRNEWRALAKLHHPNIVQVTDAGTTDEGLPYFVMEHLQGRTLADLLRAEKKPGLLRSCMMLVDVLNGLSAAHAAGVIHRDIKPPNIFVMEDGCAKLLDFGIAKLRDRAAKVVTVGGVSIGTPRYMAPEQAEGGKVDGRADIYASALVLYECVVGRGPFAHIHDPNRLVMAHLTVEPERADFVDSAVPAELADLLHRWLLKDPGSRPPGAEHAAKELKALAETLPLDPELVNAREVTLGGSYDAPTVGAPLSAALSQRRPHPPASLSKEKATDPPESVGIKDEQRHHTETFVASAIPTKPMGAQVVSRAQSLLGPARTLAWGTPERGTEKSVSGMGGVQSSQFGPLAPLAQPSDGGNLPGPRVPVVRLILAAGAVSIFVAWGVTHFSEEWSINDQNPEARELDPTTSAEETRANPPLSANTAQTTASPTFPPGEQNTQSPESPPVGERPTEEKDQRPQSSSRVPPAEGSENRASSDAAAGSQAPGVTIQVPAASGPRPSPRPSSSPRPRDTLPGSRLW